MTSSAEHNAASTLSFWSRNPHGAVMQQRALSTPVEESPSSGALAADAPMSTQARPGQRSSVPKRGNPPRSGNGFSSRYRGVIHHRRSQRYEAHIWSEGKQTYLGGFDTEYEAAVAYDLAAVKFRGQGAVANFPVENYQAELDNLESVTREELVQQLRNQGKGGQSKTSRFRGVMKHQKGKWEARLGQSCGSKYQYLGLFTTEIDAAVAFDRASIMHRGLDAVTNFNVDNYTDLLGQYDPAAVEAAAKRQRDEKAAATAAVSAHKHDWMHHFTEYRQQQAEAAAAAARQQGLTSAGAPTQPHTFKRFLDGHDESAFAQLALKHIRRSEGGGGISRASGLSPRRSSQPPAAMLLDTLNGVGASRAYSDGAAVQATSMRPVSSSMSPTEAAVVELFVTASRQDTGPALSAPAQLDERMARCNSEQTHTQPSGDAAPSLDQQASPLKQPPLQGSAFSRAATMPASGIPGPAPLDTMESVETVMHPSAGSQPSPGTAGAPAHGAPALPELPWSAWLEQLRIFVSGCQALPEAGELGHWCAEQLAAAVHLAAGSTPTGSGLTLEQYMQLTELPPFARQLSVIEAQVFWECLSRLRKFVATQLRMPLRRTSGAEEAAAPSSQEEKELADWSAMQRRLAVRLAAGLDCGQMSRERVLELVQVPGWLDVLC